MTREELLEMSDEAYMNGAQRAYFRDILLRMRDEILKELNSARDHLQDNDRTADILDRAAAEELRGLMMRFRQREARLLRKIDQALRRIDSGEYGYCEESGEPIGLPRLLARPTATLCIAVKERKERIEHVFAR